MSNHVVDLADAWIDKYHFQRSLGHGAFATVWLADETNARREVIRPVAIKVFVDDFADRASFHATFENFQSDLRFLASLAPDNPIVQYYTSEMIEIFVDRAGGVLTLSSRGSDRTTQDAALTAFLIVMEYADGGPLEAAYREKVLVQKPDQSYLDHLIDICTGLRAAHRAGIIHRDIKPSNLLWFKRANRVKIGDFGIAKHLNEIRPPGVYVMGTPPYMSPESFDAASRATPERDIYALGCTFYEILTGEPAFYLPSTSGAYPNVTVLLNEFQRLHHTATRPDAIVRAPDLISVELSGIIKEMMSVDPAKRPPLDRVIEALKREKRAPLDLFDIPQVQIPDRPVHLSRYNINPVFRRDQLKESAFFVFITMEVETKNRYRMLFALLKHFFGNTYSICELFGRYDFLIRVWSTRHHVTSFCQRVIDDVLDDNRSALHVMAIEDVSYMGSSSYAPPRNLSVAQVLVKLNETQNGDDEAEREATSWLQKNRIYVRKLTHSTKDHTVPCFCLVSQAESTSQNERLAKGALIIRQLELKIPDARRLNISVYRKAYQPVEHLENERSDYLISYVAPSFDGVARIPSVILDDLTDQRLRVVTLLASKRYFVESENVHLQLQRPTFAPRETASGFRLETTEISAAGPRESGGRG